MPEEGPRSKALRTKLDQLRTRLAKPHASSSRSQQTDSPAEPPLSPLADSNAADIDLLRLWRERRSATLSWEHYDTLVEQHRGAPATAQSDLTDFQRPFELSLRGDAADGAQLLSPRDRWHPSAAEPWLEPAAPHAAAHSPTASLSPREHLAPQLGAGLAFEERVERVLAASSALLQGFREPSSPPDAQRRPDPPSPPGHVPSDILAAWRRRRRDEASALGWASLSESASPVRLPAEAAESSPALEFYDIAEQLSPHSPPRPPRGVGGARRALALGGGDGGDRACAESVGGRGSEGRMAESVGGALEALVEGTVSDFLFGGVALGKAAEAEAEESGGDAEEEWTEEEAGEVEALKARLEACRAELAALR